MAAPLLLFDRHPARADVNMHALGLLSILVELIAEHGGHDHERTDDEVCDVATIHKLHPLNTI